ncbi:hypothetical protein L1887_61818 [Cichorium endivia]|nr:hypothetical protein L1887_61818 [Cichorium endivia]
MSDWAMQLPSAMRHTGRIVGLTAIGYRCLAFSGCIQMANGPRSPAYRSYSGLSERRSKRSRVDSMRCNPISGTIEPVASSRNRPHSGLASTSSGHKRGGSALVTTDAHFFFRALFATIDRCRV